MELLISMKAENINKTMFHQGSMMDMPSDQANPYFVMEIRDMNPEKISILHEYAGKLQEAFEGDGEYIIEETETGLKIRNKVDETKPYKKEWDKWARFAKKMHDKLEKFVYWEIIRPKTS
ncbi:MAG: hypothetical protein OXF52_05350 [Candidatus Dadabacteria bacterium]|nr:hypothetical protein [Candidatus Dadabacteria bacterium]MCY4043020.1 hypothetical protein [Candidatus Dadabacteria bacterium]